VPLPFQIFFQAGKRGFSEACGRVTSAATSRQSFTIYQGLGGKIAASETAMIWKVRSLLVSLLLPLSVGASVAENVPADSFDALREKYLRPAAIPYPDDDPYSATKESLGRALFFDPILSASGTHACATCHQPGLAFGDGLPLAVGDSHQKLPQRTPTLFDVAWIDRYGWDGKFPALERVVFGPIVSSKNLNLPEPKLIARLSARPDYKRDFAAAFSDGAIDRVNISAALATYVRTIVSGEAPFDRWIAGGENAIGADAKRGFALFNGKGRCAECHSGWAFTDGSFHDIGVAKGSDIGRGKYFPTSVKLRYAFKTPTLRNVTQRAPYMHDGSLPTLQAVIDLYDRGGIDRPSRSELIHPLHLTAQEKADLIAFLKTLTSGSAVAALPPAQQPQ
jgi:cytochrome c peroxidase